MKLSYRKSFLIHLAIVLMVSFAGQAVVAQQANPATDSQNAAAADFDSSGSESRPGATDSVHGGGHQAHAHNASSAPADITALSLELRREAGALIVQDYQGRMKPVDTLARELVRKITKRFSFGDMDPLDLYLSWLANPQYWWDRPLIYVRHPGLKARLGVDASTTHISAMSLVDAQGNYVLAGDVDETLRTPDKDRSKMQRKLLSLDERFNMLFLAVQARTFRAFPIPNDSNDRWVGGPEIMEEIPGEFQERYRSAFLTFLEGIRTKRPDRFRSGVTEIRTIQQDFGANVLPGEAAKWAELVLNRVSPFNWVLWPYFLSFGILMTAYFWNLARWKGKPFRWRQPLYLLGMILFAGALFIHLAAFILRWIASSRAPLSNGYESLIFISFAVALAGLIFEVKDRRGAAGGLSSLLTFVVLGISMMSFFEPAIGPLVPVLDSYWLNIHVTVITASYGFLGLGAFLGALILLLYLRKGPGRETLRLGINKLDHLLQNVLVAGLALLTVGTLLGGVWANESWGRYWGWDPKETWSLVTILVYAVILHFRWVPALNRPWLLAAGSFAAIASIVMTYFGVNYFLSGLHSYAEGETVTVPSWVYIGTAIMLTLIAISFLFERTRSWERQTAVSKTGDNA